MRKKQQQQQHHGNLTFIRLVPRSLELCILSFKSIELIDSHFELTANISIIWKLLFVYHPIHNHNHSTNPVSNHPDSKSHRE